MTPDDGAAIVDYSEVRPRVTGKDWATIIGQMKVWYQPRGSQLSPFFRSVKSLIPAFSLSTFIREKVERETYIHFFKLET